MSEENNKTHKVPRRKLLRGLVHIFIGANIGAWAYRFFVEPKNLDRSFQRSFQKNLDRLFQGMNDFTFNSDVLLENKLNYETEKKSLSSLTLVNNLSSNTPSTSIDSLLKNSVILSHIYLPENALYGMQRGKQDIAPSVHCISVRAGNGLLLSNEGHIVTALHVVQGLGFGGYNKVVLFDANKEVYNVIGILAYSKKYDLALLKSDLKIKDIAPIVFLHEQNLHPDMDIYNLGMIIKGDVDYDFPPSSVSIKNKKDFEIEDFISAGHFREVIPYAAISAEGTILCSALLIDGFTEEGRSGSVITDKDGLSVLGITSGMSDGSKTYAAPASKIKGLIDFYLSKLQEIQNQKKAK